MTHQAALRQEILNAVDIASPELLGLARFIHSHPELAMQEHQAAARCIELLARHGYQVQAGVAGLPTAFLGTRGQGSPQVGILVEYDALPEVGHGCGHNLLAGATLGAAVGIATVLPQVTGTVLVYGTPGEESKGGKVHMLRAGLFEGLEAALATHAGAGPTAFVPTVPGSGNLLAAQWLKVEFFGKPAHAGVDPHKGVNALNAVIETLNGINALRQHILPADRVHGVIRHGGEAVNVVPAYASAELMIRAERRRHRDELVGQVRSIAQGAALMTGCRLELGESETPYDDAVPNLTLARAIQAEFDAVGLAGPPPYAGPGIASSDVGNVSYVIPTCHSVFSIAEEDIPWHSQECAAACDADAAYAAMLKAAKALALTALDLLLDPGLVRAVRQEFETALAARAAAVGERT